MSLVSRGATLADLLVGTVLGLMALALLTALVAGAGRLLAAASARAEGEDTVQLAVEAFAFDVRRAGFDPTAAGIDAVREADSDRVAFAADLDGDGAVDERSEEAVTYVCQTAPPRLSRIVGRQSLPLASGLVRCGLRYLDETGTSLVVPATGLGVPERRRIRVLELEVALEPPGLTAPSARVARVALRTRP